MAGSPCPVEVMKRVVAEMGMAEVTICYGMTETSPVSTQTGADDDLDRRTSTVGRVHPHLEVKVVDPATGLTVPRGETGEFCTRGYSVMLGYWDEPEKTAEVIDAARWMHTGDLAVMDDEGYLNIVGRIKDMVIRGGENVYPREIEEFLYTHPDIVDAQVIGVPDERYGEELMAWVRLRPGAEPLTAEALREFCTGKLAHYKIPRYVKIVDEFPMTVTGKIRKVEMRAGLGRGARPAVAPRPQRLRNASCGARPPSGLGLACYRWARAARSASTRGCRRRPRSRPASAALIASAIFGSGRVNRFLVNQPKSSRMPRGERDQHVGRVRLEQHEHRVDDDHRRDHRAHPPDDGGDEPEDAADAAAMAVMIHRAAPRRESAQCQPGSHVDDQRPVVRQRQRQRLGRPGRVHGPAAQQVVQLPASARPPGRWAAAASGRSRLTRVACAGSMFRSPMSTSGSRVPASEPHQPAQLPAVPARHEGQVGVGHGELPVRPLDHRGHRHPRLVAHHGRPPASRNHTGPRPRSGGSRTTRHDTTGNRDSSAIP